MGWFIVIGVPPKGGKTALLTTLLKTIAYKGWKVMPVSLEMGIRGSQQRLFANIARIDMKKFRTLELTEQEWAKIEEARAEISEMDSHWSVDASDVYSLWQLALIMDPDVILVDYLQLMRGGAGRRSRTEEIELISRELKRLSNESGRPRLVIAASQFSRGFNKAGDFKSGAGFKGSGGIENDADLALNIGPAFDAADNEIPGERTLHVALSRHSGAGDEIPVFFDGAHALMGSISRDFAHIDIENYDPEVYGPTETPDD